MEGLRRGPSNRPGNSYFNFEVKNEIKLRLRTMFKCYLTARCMGHHSYLHFLFLMKIKEFLYRNFCKILFNRTVE